MSLVSVAFLSPEAMISDVFNERLGAKQMTRQGHGAFPID